MKKETIIAVVLGIVFGSGVALFLVLNTRKEETKVIPVATASKITPATAKNTPAVVQPLNITAPEQNTVISEKTVKITGKATKGSLIVIQSPISSIVKTLEKDTFAEDFPLALGENVIQVSVYPTESKTGIQQRTLVVYQLQET